MNIQILDYDQLVLGYEAYNLASDKHSKGHRLSLIIIIIIVIIIVIIVMQILQDSDIDEMFAFADANSDGRLSFQEFEVTILMSVYLYPWSVCLSVTKKLPCHIQAIFVLFLDTFCIP